ncbi:fatty acid amide hydrolase [Hordeum vulgare]|nr:fatty acid amide hydrolase [Hordeum vulgare]
MVTEAWTLAGCGGAAASKSAVVAQEVPALLHPVAKKPISLRGVAVARSACQDAIVVVGRCCGIASCLLAMLALTGASSFGPLLTFLLKKQNNMTQMLQHTVIPERPMFYPEYPPQEPEQGVVTLEEDRDPVERVEEELQCLAQDLL